MYNLSQAGQLKQTGPSSTRWRVVVLGFFAVFLDGFDTSLLSFSVPTLAQQWGTTVDAFTLPLAMTNAGVVVGYLFCGPLVARFGGRWTLTGGVILYGVGTIIVALILPVHSVALLTIIRFVSGIGLGIPTPVAVSLSTAHSRLRRREVVCILVTLGLACGLTLGGFVGGPLLETVGATGVFWVGGILPFVLAAVMLWGMKGASRTSELGGDREDARVGALLAPKLRVTTVLLWAFAFLSFVSSFVLIAWVPSLLIDYGFSATEAPLGLAYVSFGSIVGGIALIALAAKLGIARSLILCSVFFIACLVLVSRIHFGNMPLLLLLGGAGMGSCACGIGQTALAASLYTAKVRTAGIAWAAAFGRIGSIVGPGVVGGLIGLGLGARDIFLFTALPMLLATVCAIVIWLRVRARSRPAAGTPAGTPDIVNDEQSLPT